MGSIVGLDVGTTVVKAVAFDETGRPVASARRPSGFTIPQPGWAETDMEGLWHLCADALLELCGALSGRREGPVALGISGYMGGAWLLGADMRPVRPGILWNDGRALEIVHRWRQQGLLEEIFRISCNAVIPGFSVPVFAWLQEHEPAAVAKARHALFAKDWIRYRLTGELATDESDASHVPGDARTRTFSRRICELCDAIDLAALWPPVLPSGAVAGRVAGAAARQTGLPEGLPVVAGLADVSSSLTGAGAVDPGTACSIVGTSCLNNVVTAEPQFTPSGVGLSFLVPSGCWTRTMPNQTGTLALEWFKRELLPQRADGRPMQERELDEAVAAVPAGARGVIFHPYLNNTGVLAPVYEPRARARFWGLGVEHTRWDMLRAVYEGIALSMADCFQRLPAWQEPVLLVGGGARSAVWRQMFADATGRSFALVTGEEPGALGVAMLAGVAVGVWADLNEAVGACCRQGSTIDPDPRAREQYARLLPLYQRLRRDLVEEQDVRSVL